MEGKITMNETEFVNFESKINQLLSALQQANSENQFLRDKLTKALREKAELLDKNRRVVEKVKRIMIRLRNAS